jgi:hypothetical protein
MPITAIRKDPVSMAPAVAARSWALDAAVLSIAAGAVHLVAAGAHHDVALLGWLLAAAGLGQLALGALILVRSSLQKLRVIFLFNGAVVLAWVASRTVGLPLPGAAGEVQTIGVQDAIAALLGCGAAVVAWLALGGRGQPKLLHSAVGATLVAGLTLTAIVAVHDHGALDQSVPILEAGQLSARLPLEEAIALLGLAARAPLPGSSGHSHTGGGHGPGVEPAPVTLEGAQLALFEQEWAEAVAAAESLATLEEAVAAGYAQASTEALGVGAHWVKWSLVDRGFDPGRPSMLLFANRQYGKPPQLVGFSYVVASATEPEGFAGRNDVWHQHRGLCFIDGWLRSEDVERREDCADTWIDGSDLWMLHAWPVPGMENHDGQFASIHPSLCGRKPLMPDILSCDPSGF